MDIPAQLRATPRYATEEEKQLARTRAQHDYLRTAFNLMEAHPSFAPVIAATALSYLRTMSALEVRPC